MMIIELLQLNPTKLRIILAFLKDYLQRSFPEPPKPKNKRGAPRKFSRWLVIALGMIGSIIDFTWEEYISELKPLAKMINEFNSYNTNDIPGKTTIYNGFRNLEPKQIKSLTTQISRVLCEPDRVAIDSSGFILSLGRFWKMVTYKANNLKRTSRIFYKMHIIVDTATKSILAVNWSKSPDHDYPVAVLLVKQLGKKILEKIRYFMGDKAYEGPDLRSFLEKFKIRLLVEPKKGSVDHGQDTDRDRDVRLSQQSKELWKHTFKYGNKQVVEHVFGEIKLNLCVNARKRTILKRQLLIHFLMYNLNLYLKMEIIRRREL